jgi:hypothetical protein
LNHREEQQQHYHHHQQKLEVGTKSSHLLVGAKSCSVFGICQQNASTSVAMDMMMMMMMLVL